MFVTGDRTCWRACITFTRNASTALRPISSRYTRDMSTSPLWLYMNSPPIMLLRDLRTNRKRVGLLPVGSFSDGRIYAWKIGNRRRWWTVFFLLIFRFYSSAERFCYFFYEKSTSAHRSATGQRYLVIKQKCRLCLAKHITALRRTRPKRTGRVHELRCSVTSNCLPPPFIKPPNDCMAYAI